MLRSMGTAEAATNRAAHVAMNTEERLGEELVT